MPQCTGTARTNARSSNEYEATTRGPTKTQVGAAFAPKASSLFERKPVSHPARKEPRSPMQRKELVRKLVDRKNRDLEMMGLPPYKSQQVVAESVAAWEKLPTEKLQEILDKGEV
jgi:hypothetical protein